MVAPPCVWVLPSYRPSHPGPSSPLERPPSPNSPFRGPLSTGPCSASALPSGRLLSARFVASQQASTERILQETTAHSQARAWERPGNRQSPRCGSSASGGLVRATAPRGRWSCSCRFSTKGRRLWGRRACAPNKDGCTWRGYARRAGGGGSPAPVSPRDHPPPGLRPVRSSRCHNRQQMFSDELLGEDTASATLSVGHPQTSPIRLKVATLQTPRFRAGDKKSCRSQQPQ